MKKKSNYELDQSGLYPTVFYIIKQSEKDTAIKNNIPIYEDDFNRLYLKFNETKEIYFSLIPKSLRENPFTVTKLPAHLNKLN